MKKLSIKPLLASILFFATSVTVTTDSVAAEMPAFTMAQTLSPKAQLTTLAFSGLAMMTGNLAAQSFFPPGKVADYTGFQYLRDNDPDHMGHNTSFLTRIAFNMIYILDDAQLAKLASLAVSQQDKVDLYGLKRFPLMQAFRRQLEGDIPDGSKGLNQSAVRKASRELYSLDGEIAFERAYLYADIIRSMNASQIAYLDAMKGNGWKSWPDISTEQIQTKLQAMPRGSMVAVMTYAGDIFSWYAGSTEADIYFCPERHGTYFGAFYMKDAPAIGHEGYGINEQLTATAGLALSDPAQGYVTRSQAAMMASLLAKQKANMKSIVAYRKQIAQSLRSLLKSTAVADDIQAHVMNLSAAYGDLDGKNNHAYATTFAKIYATLSAQQKANLQALRQSIMSGTYADGTPYDFSVASTPYLYSQSINDLSQLAPWVTNTDAYFYQP